MTLNVHDGGFGSGGYDEDEEGATTAGNRDHRDAASGTCGDGDDDVGDSDDRGDGEPYVVFGYGSLIFRVRLCRPSIPQS